jgi:hypothetical protein
MQPISGQYVASGNGPPKRLLSDAVSNVPDSASAVAARLSRSYNGGVCRIEIILAKIDWKVRISSRQEKMSNLVKCLLTPVIILSSVYSCAADQWRPRINGVQVWLDSSQGITLHRIGDTIASDAGRLFGVCVGDRRLYSDEVRVRSGEVVNMAASLRIPFDLPDGLGYGVLSLTAGAEPGVIDVGLSLTGQRRAKWRVLFPLLEKLSVDDISQDKLEFFFPMQEGWIGRGQYDLGVAYGYRAWLPILAAWNPAGTGIALQSRDATCTYRSLRIRNASPGKTVPTYRPDPLDMASAFPMESSGLSLSVSPIGFELSRGQNWQSATAAIHVYDGRQLFKAPLKSYEKWARATWWKHRKTPDWLRDSFLSFPVHEHGGAAGFLRGLYDGKKFICADQAEQYQAATGGHAFVEWYQWWNHGEKLTAGPFAGSLHPFAGMGDYRLEPSWGGLLAYRTEIDRLHNAGARVCLYLLGGSVWKTSAAGRQYAQDWGVMRTPGKVEEVWSGQNWSGITTQFWDMCSEAAGWQQLLRDTAHRLLTETGADAVRLDTKAEVILCHNPNHPHADDPLRGLLTYLRTIRQGVDAAGPDKALMGEFAGSDAAAQYFDATLAQGHDIDTPLVSQMTPYGISPFRWVFPEMKCIEWGNVPKDYHNTSRRMLFNGIGITSSDLSSNQLAEVTRFAEAMRSVGDILGSTDCEPLVPTLVAGVYANRFSLGNRQVYTFWNQSKSDASGNLIAIPGGPGRRFVDLLSGRTLKVTRSGSADEVELALPTGEAAIVGVFPKTIATTPTARGIK